MQLLTSLNWFDIVLAVLVIASIISGLRTGLARVVIGLVSTVAGFLLGFWCYRMVAVKIYPVVQSKGLADTLGFMAVFIGVVAAGALVAALLSSIFKWVGLSWFNHLLGGAAGLLRGALMVAVLADVLVAFAPSPTPAFLQNSLVLPYANQVAALLSQFAPQELKDSFDQQMQNLKQYRASRRQGQII